jgi:hypothetical protein
MMQPSQTKDEIMSSMFPPGKEPLPFETASDRFAAALEQFGQHKEKIEFPADHVMPPTEAEALTGPPNYPTFAVRALPPKPVAAKPQIVWETIDGKRVARRLA